MELTFSTLNPGQTLPSVLSCQYDDAADVAKDNDLLTQQLSWLQRNTKTIDEQVYRAGVLLLRGFDVNSPDSFRAVCAAINPALQKYTGGDSPRTGVVDKVYTSTEYAEELEVLLHNELSYAGWSPQRVFFGCLIPSETGGETHLADGRRVYSSMDPKVRNRFEEKGVTYLQHLWCEEGEPGVGKSWQQTFETHSRAEAEQYLIQTDMTFEWTEFGIRTAAKKPAVRTHNITGEHCWHNQADQWHRLMPSVKDTVGNESSSMQVNPSSTAGIETLGNHVTFGDGSEISVDDLQHIRSISRQCEIKFPWQRGDIMVIDNVLCMHGRKPFTGQRQVLVAMA
jgi:alpha-ketoglutarate-dependent taurine dioxygenase